jgi:preprotein translocase subunit SecA
MSIFTSVLRAGEGKKVRRLRDLVPLVNAQEANFEALSDDELAATTELFTQRLANGETLEDILVEAYALVREASWRVLGQRHFDVQVMGGMALHFGWIAEMKTGEGKTLVSTLPVYLNALAGNGVHVVTANDYLATRDSEWMGQVHRFLGLTVARVGPDITDRSAKREAYAADITYGTNTEFGFDYLRDNMARTRSDMVQRGHSYGIIDEIDSILIDEARTPLIISGPSTQTAQLYHQFAAIARTLRVEVDYELDEEKRTVVPTEEGIAVVEHALKVPNLYDSVSVNYVHHLSQALLAKELYKRDKDYLIRDGQVHIIDEFTGRTIEGRRWSDGLHQAVEAKERVRIEDENHTVATVTLQHYFRLYSKLAGMTGTAETEASEFANTYELPVVPIPPNRPLARIDHPDLIFKTEQAKFEAVIDDIVRSRDAGQPVLVGTASVAKSEHLSRLLSKRGIPHEVLNAKQHFREAHVVAQAGRPGAVTVATNMAGRGVDIILGGNPQLLAEAEFAARGLDTDTPEATGELSELVKSYEELCAQDADLVREAGGLYVLGSERHESRRIDNQLRGRAGRQGDPGQSRFFLSLEDDLLRLFATGTMDWVMGKALPDDRPIEAKMVSKSIERAQNTVEARNAEQRKDVLKYDDVMNEQRKVIYGLRYQIITGYDLHEDTQDLIASTFASITADHLPSDYQEEWDVDGLLAEITLYCPVEFTPDDLYECGSADQVAESLIAHALELYASREDEFSDGATTARELERAVMLEIIDQRWGDHLAEMDYLREGINLRAMGNQDPLVSYQRDGFAMFETLMAGIDDDYLRYVFHVNEIRPDELDPDTSTLDQAQDTTLPPQPAPSSTAKSARPTSVFTPTVPPPTPDQVLAATQIAAAVTTLNTPTITAPKATKPAPAQTQRRPKPTPRAQPSKGSSDAKVGRNDPCWCGSGKKYKLCHGAA